MKGKTVFIDDSVLKDFLDRKSPEYGPMFRLCTFIQDKGGCKAVISNAVIVDMMTPLLEAGQHRLIDKLNGFLTQSRLFRVEGINEDNAAHLEKLHLDQGLSLLDATQIVTAINCKADFYLTAKTDLCLPASLERLLLWDFV